MAAALAAIGLRQRDVVSFFSENSSRWAVTDLAIMTLGAAAAVRGVAAPLPELTYIYRHSRSVALVVEHVAVLDKLIAAGLSRPSLRFVLVLFGNTDSYESAGFPVYSYDQLLQMGDAVPAADRPTCEKVVRDDIATVLYTSGTTGNPKGVPLTHANILSQLEDISLGSLDPGPGSVFLSILPCWHVFERTAAYWCLSKGVKLVYTNKRRFREDLVKHRPDMLISVPRVFENLHEAIMTKLEAASIVRRAIFALFYAISLSFVKARRRLRNLDVTLPRNWRAAGRIWDMVLFALLSPLYFVAERVLWSKLRERFGGKLRICLSGGGSLAGYLEDFFECVGVTICVGYGLTETSPVIANRFGQHNVRGSTGVPLPRAYVKIVDLETKQIVKPGDHGTLFVGGPYVFSGYLKDPEATAKAFDSEGYFNTGDLAYNTPDGDIVMAGRSKDIIVLSNGENVEPGPIEDAISASPLIDQVMLVGQDQRALGALVVPRLAYLVTEGLLDQEYRMQLEKLVQAPDDNAAELRRHEDKLMKLPGLQDAIDKDIKRMNESRSNYSPLDRVTNFRLILVPFTVENGMATQTLKIKKNVISKIYADEIAKTFAKM